MPAPRRLLRFAAPLVGAAALAFAAAPGTPAMPGTGSAAVHTPPGPLVTLNAYCQGEGSLGHLADGQTVHCVRVARTDAFVWSYLPGLMSRDPNSVPYTCDNSVCRMPDGSIAPGYTRCGLLCGEPPTSGDIQSGLADCIATGASFQECSERVYR